MICNIIDEEFFNIIVTENLQFSGSEEGKKLNFEGERYTVTEPRINNIGNILFGSCSDAGFDSGFTTSLSQPRQIPPPPPLQPIQICTVFEGDCTGFIADGERKECTIKNYVVGTFGGR